MTTQTDSLQGKILNNFNETLAGVNVLVKESSKGSNTDFDGKFIINNLQKGDYTIVIYSISYKTKELNVTIPSSELEIILFEGTEYFSTRGFSTQPQMVNGLHGVTLSAIDPSCIERIEVIKGAVVILSLQELLIDPTLAPLKPMLALIVNPMLLKTGSLLQTEAFTRIFDKKDSRAKHINFQQNFTGDFKLGTMCNHMIIELDSVVSNYNYKNKNRNPIITSTSNFPQLLNALNSVPQLAPTASIFLIRNLNEWRKPDKI